MTNSAIPGRCFRVLTPRRNPALRLFCFPHAGSGASAYLHWAKLFSEQIEVVAVQLPGRENRLSEPPFTSMEQVVPFLAVEISSYLEQPFVFFGHSMGALIAFELSRYMNANFDVEPLHLFVSGHAAPKLPKERLYDLPVEEMLARIQSFSGTPEEVMTSPELLSILVPLLRADFSVCQTYIYAPQKPLSCPVTAFAGNDDVPANHEVMRHWQEESTGSFSLYSFPGSHFFILSSAPEIVGIVEQQVQACMRVPAAPFSI
jgi:surfactin synthase thioesterase subunit